MTGEIYCSTSTTAADFDLELVRGSRSPLEPPGDLAGLVRRYRSPRSAVVVQAVAACLRAAGPDLPAAERRGIALGTATGAGADIEEFLTESIRLGDHLVNPALFPLTVHNAAAGHAAMAGQCRGPNVVISAGVASVWSALDAARALLDDGMADVMVVGGFESQRLGDGTTGSVASVVALGTTPATLTSRRLADLDRPRPDRSGDVAALVAFADAFSPHPDGSSRPAGPRTVEVALR